MNSPRFFLHFYTFLIELLQLIINRNDKRKKKKTTEENRSKVAFLELFSVLLIVYKIETKKNRQHTHIHTLKSDLSFKKSELFLDHFLTVFFEKYRDFVTIKIKINY